MQLRRLALIASMVLVFAACGGDDEPAEGSPSSPIAESDDPMAELRNRLEGQPVRMGTSGSNNASLVGVLKTVEFLRDDFGVDIDFRQLDSDPLVAAMISGDLDVGELSLAGLADAVTTGADFVGFAGAQQKNTFIVMAKSDVAGMEELAGEPFAATQNLAQITGQTARKCLDSVGLDIERDVQLLRLGNTGEVTQAIVADQVVAGISALHRISPLLATEGTDAYTILCRGWEANPQLASVWFSSSDFLEQNSDFALALNIAALKAARWMQDNKDEWVEFATTNIENLEAAGASIDYDTLVGELDMWPVNGSLEIDLAQQTLDTSVEFGVLEGDLAVGDLIHFDFQAEALEILGEN